jgi:hypothetical protein
MRAASFRERIDEGDKPEAVIYAATSPAHMTISSVHCVTQSAFFSCQDTMEPASPRGLGAIRRQEVSGPYSIFATNFSLTFYLVVPLIQTLGYAWTVPDAEGKRL